MKRYEGFKSEQSGRKFPMLPAGTYVAAIKNAKVDGQEPDQQLVLRLEIIEGDYAGYYTKRYEHDSQNAGFDQQFQAKYKGDFRLQVPNPKNAIRQHPEWDIKAFNNAMYAIEHSNTGSFDWDAIFDSNFALLKGKTVGINVREGTYNGNAYTQIGRLEVADDVRQGLVEIMKPKEPRGQSVTGVDEPSGFVGVETDELPF